MSEQEQEAAMEKLRADAVAALGEKMSLETFERNAWETWPGYALTPEDIRLRYDQYVARHAEAVEEAKRNPMITLVIATWISRDVSEMVRKLPFQTFRAEGHNIAKQK